MPHHVPILMYHSVDKECSDAYRRWTMSPANFGRQMKLLAENEYRPVSVSELVGQLNAGGTIPPKTVAITFDDGLRDFLTGAMPVLQHYRFPATLYVVSGCVGATGRWLAPLGEGSRAMLNWEELRSLALDGIEIGAHTHSHPQLDLLRADTAFAEIRNSKTELERGLGQCVQSFAYPHGYASFVTRRLVQEAGFTSACRVRHALSSTSENFFAMSRIIMTHDISDKDLMRYLNGTGLPIAPPCDRSISRAWRLVRRFKSKAGIRG